MWSSALSGTGTYPAVSISAAYFWFGENARCGWIGSRSPSWALFCQTDMSHSSRKSCICMRDHSGCSSTRRPRRSALRPR